ncbi:poly(R)-hydroxyalkanoic acid synthase subunit PhaE [Streptococcus marmotae]|uniref:poly(R)-hydroxyalkanoic acid synthase subunit PhaE n=1 Tax=Streptococcus marmotae TaxID=1825069 RepID=UPI00082FBD4C|nr:poly(R)-hydroxyalkanoic acid synthase subunit PhaE [Streptococcus marmotae]
MANLDMMNQWFEAQKKMAEQWQSLLPFGQENSDKKTETESLLNAQQQFFKEYTKAFTNPASLVPGLPFTNPIVDSWSNWQSTWAEQLEKNWKDSPWANYVAQFPDMNTYLDFYRRQFNPSQLADVMDSDSYAMFLKMMDANQHFVSFYRYFDKIRELYTKPLETDGKEWVEKVLVDQQRFYTDFVQPFIPSQLRQVLEAPYELGSSLKESWGKFLEPWAGSFFELARLYVEGANGDTEKLADYFKLWKAQYEETVAPFLRIPGMGNHTEKLERHNAFIDNSIELILTSIEFQQRLSNVTRKRAKSLFEEYLELIKKGEHPQTYKEFYQHWSNEVEKTLQEYFYSDEFSQLLARFGTANSQFIIARNKLLELSLRNLPVVLESDARSLYKKVQELKRDVNLLKRELKDKKEPLEEPKETKPKSPKKASTK